MASTPNYPLEHKQLCSFSKKVSQPIIVPETFQLLCKHNVHLGKILLSCTLYEVLAAAYHSTFHVAFSLENKAFPLDYLPLNDIKNAAKVQLEQARRHQQQNTSPASHHPKGILVTDAEFEAVGGTIHLAFDLDMKRLTFTTGEDLFTMTEALVLHAFSHDQPLDMDAIAALKSNMEESFQRSETTILEQNTIVNKAWNEVFDQALDGRKSFFSNGGDSIQAIRFMSKIKSFGYEGDFGELLSAKALDHWEIRPISDTAMDGSLSQTRYALSATQQKIWGQSINSQGAYHEQFLFKLEVYPDVEAIQKAMESIWNAYPQLRVALVFEDEGWKQEIRDWRFDFRVHEQGSDVEHILELDRLEPFTERLMRCHFFINTEGAYLLWSHHHVLLDGWSVGLLIQKFIHLVETGEALDVQPNYQWLILQEELKRNQNKSKTWEWFFQQHHAIRFPALRPDTQEFLEYTTACNLAELDAHCHEHGLTAQQLFLGALSVVMFSVTGQSNSFVHSISSGRSLLPEHADTAVGLLIKNIHLGWSWNPSDTLRTLVQKTVEGQNFGLGLEHFPPDSEVTSVAIPDVLYVFENYPYTELRGANLQGSLVFNRERTGYPLTLLVLPSANDYQVKVIYHTKYFDENTVQYMLQQLHDVLHMCLSDFDQALIPFESGSSSPNPTPYPCWTECVEKQIKSMSVELIDSDSKQSVDATSFQKRVFQINHELSAYAPGSRIALLGKIHVYTPCLIYGILRSGYTYVPINPSWPAERIHQVLNMANCRAIVHTEPLREAYDIPTHSLDSILKAKEKTDLPKISLHQEAYILFTSGTTGLPKGVVFNHKNVSSFLDACAAKVDTEAFKWIFSLTNIGFDLSIFENLFGLYCGKSIVVVGDLSALESAILTFPGGLLNSVPSVLSKLQAHEIAQLSVIQSAGEPFTEALWLRLKEANNHIMLKNWYGPTETTTYSTCIDLSHSYIPSIGQALPHERIKICNARMQEVPEGIEGEVVIAGDGVAQGYLDGGGGFFTHLGIPHYRTGDYGKQHEGLIFLKGRKDRQVKRLGQRFDLNEIEIQLLREFPTIFRLRYTVNQHRFILFIEQEGDATEKVRQALHRHFPVYMHPDEIYFVGTFPVNSNGKIDETALLEGIQKETNTEAFETSSTELLSQLKALELFKDLREDFGFIAQGGDSIIALRLIGKLKSWGYSPGMKELLDAPKLSDFFDQLSKEHKRFASQHALPLTPIQHWFTKNYKRNRNHFNQSILLEIHAPVSSETLQTFAQAALSAFPILAQVYQNTWSSGIPPQITRRICHEEAEISDCCQKIQQSFDLAQGPVAGGSVMEFDEKKFLFIAIHHFYCDGFSWRIILDELKLQMQGGTSTYGDSNVYAQVQGALASLSPQHLQGPLTFENPFQGWEPSTYRLASYLEVEWDQARTNVFMQQWEASRHVNEKVLFLVLETWHQLNLPRVTPMMETHGRSYEGVLGITESLGWFTQFYPVPIDFSTEVSTRWDRITEGYRLAQEMQLTYMGTENYQKPEYPLLLNFLGSFDENWGGMASPSLLDQGDMVDPDNYLLAHVEINGLIVQGKLKWSFRSNPLFNLETFVDCFSSISNVLLHANSAPQQVYDEGIDEDDRNAIEDLLKDL